MEEKKHKSPAIGTKRTRKATAPVSSFALEAATIDSAVAQVRELLEAEGIDKKEALRLSFALDSLLLGWFERGLEGSQVEISIKKVLQSRKLVVEARGDTAALGDMEGSAFMSSVMGSLQANGLAWSVSRTMHCVRAELALPRKRLGSGTMFLIAIALAVITVLVLSIVPGGLLGPFVEVVVTPLFQTGIGLLSALMGPMVFLSVIASILGVGDIGAFKRMGKCSVVRIMQANVAMVAFAVVGLLVIVGVNVSVDGGSSDVGQEIIDLILSIIPTSFFQPFIDGNILQIMVWALLFGIGTILLSSRFRAIGGVIFDLNDLVQWAVRTIARFMPLFVYLAIVRLATVLSADDVFTLLRYLAALALCGGCYSLWVIVSAARRRGVGFGSVLTQMLPVLTTAFLTASSAACYAPMIDVLKKLSVRDDLVQFHVPFGVVLCQAGPILACTTVLGTNACFEGTTLSVVQFVMLLLLAFLMGVATPSVPGGIIALYAVMFSAMGFSDTYLPLFIAVDLVADMIASVPKIAAIIATCMIADVDLQEQTDDADGLAKTGSTLLVKD